MVQSVLGRCKLGPKFVVQSNRVYAPDFFMESRLSSRAYSIAPQILGQVFTHPKLTEPSKVSLHCLQWKFAVSFQWICLTACTPTHTNHKFAVVCGAIEYAPRLHWHLVVQTIQSTCGSRLHRTLTRGVFNCTANFGLSLHPPKTD